MTGQAKKLACIDDLLILPEGSRVELINGEIVPKEAVSFEHSDAQSSIAMEIKGRFGKGGGGNHGGWWVVTEVLTNYDMHQAYQHDLAGWRRSRVPIKPTGRSVSVRPDWVCEILSPSNWRTDTVTKFEVLRIHEVPNYWVVDIQHQELTVYRWSKEGYLVVQKAIPGQKVALEPFDEFNFDISVLFGGDPTDA